MIQKTYHSLFKATQVNRVHPRDIQPPGLVRARNFIPSRSDMALTLRPDIINYTSNLYCLGSYVSVDDAMNTVVFSQKTGNRAWINRICPMEEGTSTVLCSKYETGSVTVSGKTVTGSGTAWIANVWPHCWISVDGGTTYVRVKTVYSDSKLETYDDAGDVSGATYTILRTHDYERADYPIHQEPYINSLIYNSCSPKDSDHSTTISGPFRSSLERSGESWVTVPPATGGTADTFYTFYDMQSDGANPDVVVAVGAKYVLTAGVWTGIGVICTTSDGSTWTDRSTLANALFSGVHYANGTWVAVGGVIPLSGAGCAFVTATSSNGSTWTQSTHNQITSTQDEASVTYANGIWVCATGSGLATSPDGTTWTSQSSSGVLASQVVHNGTYFIAVGRAVSGQSWVETVLRSTDGLSWIKLSATGIATNLQARGLAWDSSASKLILVGDYWDGTKSMPLAYTAASTGEAWTALSIPAEGSLTDIKFNSTAGYCIAVGYGAYKIASGTTVTPYSLPQHVSYTSASHIKSTVCYRTTNADWLCSGHYGKTSQFNGTAWSSAGDTSSITYRTALATVATGWTGLSALGSPGWLTRSVDLSTFLSYSTGLPGAQDVYGSIFGTMPSTAVGLVVVGKDGLVGTSTNGLTWTSQTSGESDDFYGIAIKDDNSRYVAVGKNGNVYTCDDDGVTWVAQTTEYAAKGTITFTGVPVAGQTFTIDSQTFTWVNSGTATGDVVVGGDADACVTNVVTSVTRDLATVTAVDGAGSTVVITAVAAGAAGNAIVFANVDSANMTVDGSGTLGATQLGQDAITEDLKGVARNSSLFVAVGTGGTIITSADGVTWTARTSGTAADLYAIVWGGTTAKWVAVGNEVLLYSSNGTSWSAASTSATGLVFNAVCTDATNYLAAGDGGIIYSSADADNWTARSSNQTENLYACVYTATGTDWWVFGASGLILKADSVSAAWVRQMGQASSGDLYDIYADTTNAMAVGPNGNVYRIISGIYSKCSTAPGVDFYGVTSNGTTWVLVGANGACFTTTDFSTFTQRDPDTASTLYSVCWDGTEFVAVGANGITTHSADGTTWAHVHSGGTDNFRKVRLGAAELVLAVGDGGATYYSQDHGATWTAGFDVNDDLRDAACDTDVSWAERAAVGTITFTGVPSEDETFVIDTVTFTWKAARTGAGEVEIGGNAAGCVTNAVTAITADVATVTASDGTGDTVVVTAATAGTAGNSIVFDVGTSSNMTMDGSGVLGGTTSGRDETHVWIVVSSNGAVYKNTGITLASAETITGNISGGLFGCKWVSPYYWVVGANGSIYFASKGSADAGVWTKLSATSTDTLYSITVFGGKQYVAGASGTITSSTGSALLETFKPLSSLYRANVFAVVDGYVILFGTSEYNSTKKEWEWQRRRIRWTAPGTYDDFSTAGQAGFADVFGEGNFLDARTLGHSVLIWESSNVSILSQTGILEAPWEYRVIEWSNRMISNPVVVNQMAYWVEASGLLYQSDGVTVSPVAVPFDLTEWSDYDTASTVQLQYDESSGCLVIFKPVTSGTPICYFYSPELGIVTECVLNPTTIFAEFPCMIAGIAAGQGVPTLLVGYENSSGAYPTLILVAKFDYGAAIAGEDALPGLDALHYGITTKWYGEIITGFLPLAGPGEKIAVRAALARTYQDAATVRYALCGRGSDEDSWTGASDTNGTISLSTTAVTGSGTMFSALLGTSTGSETVYTGAVQPAWTWNVVVTDSGGTVQTTPSYTVTGAYEITFGAALTSGWRVYAYWDADPSPFMKVGDLIETTQGMHEIATITNRAAATATWYPSTTLTGTHWHTDTPASGEKEAYVGLQLLVDSLQVRIIVVPSPSSTATKVKVLGIELHWQPSGVRQMVR